MLMNHADAGSDGSSRFPGRKRFAKYLDRALVSHIMAEEDVHQSRLAGSVFAKQAHNFPGAHLDTHGIICQERAETLGYAAEPKDDLQIGRASCRERV